MLILSFTRVIKQSIHLGLILDKYLQQGYSLITPSCLRITSFYVVGRKVRGIAFTLAAFSKGDCSNFLSTKV
ncbi:MAG: hypothetical protein ACI87J_000718 [Colwellia sp.]|jgi:hypothetical protein